MRNKGVVAGGTEPLRLFAANNIKLRLPLFVMYTTPIFIFDTRQSVDFFPTIYRRSIRLPSLEYSTATIKGQRTKAQRPPTSFNRTNPTMDRPRSSGYGNPLTFNVAVMFLFYILSVTLCLSSFSTCVCVIFSPIGTFRAIANYLFYALGLTVLSTFLLAALFGVYFGNPTSPESQRMNQIEGETLIREDVQEEVPAPQQADDAAPAQETHHEVSTTREGVETTPIRKGHRQGSAAQEVVQNMLTQGAYPEVSSAQEVGKATLSATASQQTALEDVSEKLSVDTAKTADGTPRSCEETPAPPEQMGDAAGQEKNAPEANTTDHTETAGFEKATANVITPRESKKIEKWISQTNSADALKGDEADADADDLTEETTETMAMRRNDGGSPSETRSVSQDSDFQNALRVYMGKGPRGGGRQGRSSDATPSSESSEGSEFQRSVRRGVRAGEGWGERGWGEGWESA